MRKPFDKSILEEKYGNKKTGEGWNQELAEKIISETPDATYNAIADFFGVSYSTARKHLFECKKNSNSSKQVDTVREYCLQNPNATAKDVARILGTNSKSKVYNFLRDNNIPFKCQRTSLDERRNQIIEITKKHPRYGTKRVAQCLGISETYLSILLKKLKLTKQFDKKRKTRLKNPKFIFYINKEYKGKKHTIKNIKRRISKKRFMYTYKSFNRELNNKKQELKRDFKGDDNVWRQAYRGYLLSLLTDEFYKFKGYDRGAAYYDNVGVDSFTAGLKYFKAFNEIARIEFFDENGEKFRRRNKLNTDNTQGSEYYSKSKKYFYKKTNVDKRIAEQKNLVENSLSIIEQAPNLASGLTYTNILRLSRSVGIDYHDEIVNRMINMFDRNDYKSKEIREALLEYREKTMKQRKNPRTLASDIDY